MQKEYWSHIWGAASLVMAAVLLIVQLLQWKRHGDDFIFVGIGMVVTVLVWAICVYAIMRNVKDARRASSLHAQIQTLKDNQRTELEGLRSQNADDIAKVRNQTQGKIEELTGRLAEATKALADDKLARVQEIPTIGKAVFQMGE